MTEGIRNRQFMQQIKNFEGLHWGSIRPMDLDVFLDFRNKLFVFIEVKYGNGNLPTGQKLAIERICDACKNDQRDSVALVATHQTQDDIYICQASVVKYRYNGKWLTPKEDITVKEAIDKLLSIKNLNY